MSDLIDRQLAINALMPIYKSASLRNRNVFSTARKCMATIEELPSAQQWIPCSERLPDEEKGTYWVCTDTEYQCKCRWTNVNHIWTELTTNWHWHIMDIPQYTKVIAWMPLPEPYKGQANCGARMEI